MHPRLDAIGLPTWALLVTAGVVLCWLLLIARTRRLGYPTLKIYLWLLTAFPVGALGAGFGAGLVRLFKGDVSSLDVGFATTGMTVLGAVIAVGAYSVAYIRIVLRERPWRLLDAAAFTYPLALAFGRIGCLMNGCCYGRVADTALGPFTLELGVLSEGTVGRAHYAGMPEDTLLWNLPLVLSLLALATLAVTEWAYRRKERWSLPDGTVILVALLADATTRFFAEFLREEPALEGVGLNPWQAWVLGLWAVAVGALVLLLRRRRPTRSEVVS